MVGRVQVDDAHAAMATPVMTPGPAPAGRSGPAQPRRTPAERLAELEQRYRAGKVPQREYRRIRGNILAATAPPPGPQDARPFPAPPPTRADLRTRADPPGALAVRAAPGPDTASIAWSVLPAAPLPVAASYPTLAEAPSRAVRAPVFLPPPRRANVEWYPILAALALLGLMAVAYALFAR